MRSTLAWLVVLAACLGCSRSGRQEAGGPADAPTLDQVVDVRLGPDIATEDFIAVDFAIYYLPKPTKDPLAEIDRLLKGDFAIFHRVDELTGGEEQPSLKVRLEDDPQTNASPPTLEMLAYFGRGLSREQAEALQSTEQVLVLAFDYPKKHVIDGLRAANALVQAVASATDGLIWDRATREIFTPLAWQEKRIDGWREPFPNISEQMTIHAYKDGEFVRAVTLGMAKFGLPDLVVQEFTWSSSRNVGNTINALAQVMLEGARVPGYGNFDLDLRKIQNADVREAHVTTLKPNATGIVLLSCTRGKPEEGDPDNRLIEITFDRGDGPDSHARQEQILGQAFGWEDAVVAVKHDGEIEQASQQAREKLPELRAEFERGLAPGESILVKVPFPRPDGGHEYMWVEVTSWEGDKIAGLLQNEPFHIPTLHGGQKVDVSQAEVFDYIRKHADGTSEGNLTAELLQKAAQP